jgi:hypothetical protein
MNRWIKIILPTILSAVVVAVLLMASGLGTIQLIDSSDNIVTKTVVKLDLNTFTMLMITGVSLTVLFTGVIIQAIEKPSRDLPTQEAPLEQQEQQPTS